MRAFIYGTLLAFALASVAKSVPLSENELKNLLAAVRQNRSTQADFQEERVIRLMKKPVVSSGTVWFQPPNKFRREVKGNSPSVTVSDGQQLWIYYPKFQSAEHYSLGKHSPLDTGIEALTAALNLENVENNYHISANKLENGFALELSPRNPSLKRLLKTFNIQMNPELQVQRTEMVQPNGDHIVTVYSNESRAAIDPANFEFTPPAGTNVTTPLGR